MNRRTDDPPRWEKPHFYVRRGKWYMAFKGGGCPTEADFDFFDRLTGGSDG